MIITHQVENALLSLDWNGVEEREELEERRAKLTAQLDEAVALKVASLFYSSWSSSSLILLFIQPSKLRSHQHNNGNRPQN